MQEKYVTIDKNINLNFYEIRNVCYNFSFLVWEPEWARVKTDFWGSEHDPQYYTRFEPEVGWVARQTGACPIQSDDLHSGRSDRTTGRPAATGGIYTQNICNGVNNIS